MIKIDLHIHTVNTVSDADFEFDLDTLEKYVTKCKLDIIAVTNHNLFDLEQYNEIKEKLDILVLPGIEIDLEEGHILVICNPDNVSIFNEKTLKVKRLLPSNDSKMEIKDFLEIFESPENYIIIPHYKKSPSIKNETIKLIDGITAGEVSSVKKFNALKRDVEELIPVLFSDVRIKKDMDMSSYATFLNVENPNFENIKLALKDRTKVSLGENKPMLFKVLGDVYASTKLNLIVGNRSSGKTYLLDSLKNDESSKYIKQFSIVKEADEKIFKNKINDENSIDYKNYTKELNSIIELIIDKDEGLLNKNIEAYLSSLKKNASEFGQENEFSKAKIFNSAKFDVMNDGELDTIISAAGTLFKANEKYSTTIQKFFTKDNTEKLLKELIDLNQIEIVEKRLLENSNSIIDVIKDKLEIRSSKTRIEDLNIIDWFRDIKLIEEFDNAISDILSEEIELQDKKQEIYGFTRRVKRKEYKTAGDVQKALKTKIKIKEDFVANYKKNKFFNYLKCLKSNKIKTGDLSKTLFELVYETKNKEDAFLSGGERAEYLLLKEIENSRGYDLLLIDEPEASFDNVFLNTHLRELIKNISEKTTVFLSTHNQSLGSLLNPERLLFTEVNDGKYNIYSGGFENGDLKDSSGNKKDCFQAIINSLESGETTYDERAETYENLKNRR